MGASATTPSPTQTDTVVDANILTYDFGYRFFCGECEGRVSRLELRYNGAVPAVVRVERRKGGAVEFPDTLLNPGDEFELFGTDKQGTLGPEIHIFVNGAFHTNVHTSCSQPIFPGLVSGDFEVVSGDSRRGGRLCPAGGGLQFTCSKPIDALTMIWDGGDAVRVKAWKGDVGSTVLKDQDNVAVGSEFEVTGLSGSKNDIIWELFEAGTSSKIGDSRFHISCSDTDMNGAEDCGKRQGDGKGNDSSLINDWILEGIVDSDETLDCTP